jgi:predicted transcriptional regulator
MEGYAMAEVMMPGPETLIKMRRVMNLPLQAVAQRSGIHLSTLSRWENAKAELSDEQVDAVARVIHEESWKKSEQGNLPKATDVSADAAERGREFRAKRLEWGVTQLELSEATKLPHNLISLFERNYVEFDPEEEKRLNNALRLAIDTKSSMLAWCKNSGELQRRRENLGVSRKKLARATGHNEDWLTRVGAGEIALDEETANPLWEYLAELQIAHGKEGELRAMLSAPVRIELKEPEEKPISFAKKAKLTALQQQVSKLTEANKLLRKSLDISKQMYRNEGESLALRTWQVNELEERLTAMQKIVGKMPPGGEEREELTKLLRAAQDEVINA